MVKIKYTKTELKRQRDNLKRFEHYLPILQLKKQQLQIEIQRAHEALSLKAQEIDALESEISEWAQLLNEDRGYLKKWITPQAVIKGVFNIAGVDIPVFEGITFEEPVYDLFSTPLWVDKAISIMRDFVTLLEEEKVLQEKARILSEELRITNQRVNLFEKIKIPESKEYVRVIRIYLGEQETQAVGRCKIAKAKAAGVSVL